MRIRGTKPEFWRSERIASVDWDTRFVLKGLESYVDDNGVGKDDLALIVADVFPRDLSRNPTGTLRKVSEALGSLSQAGLLWRYEVDGTKLLYIAFWESVQRIEKPGKGRFPRPDGTMDYRESKIRESSRNPPGTLPEPSGLEQGNRGTGEQGRKDLAPAAAPAEAEPDLFDAFWSNYPRKDNKAQARKAWPKACKRLSPERLVKAAEYWAGLWSEVGKDREHIPHASTWLNNDRWNDEPPARPARAAPTQNSTDAHFANMLRNRPGDGPQLLALPGGA
jgi:hypothetical protein